MVTWLPSKIVVQALAANSIVYLLLLYVEEDCFISSYPAHKIFSHCIQWKPFIFVITIDLSFISFSFYIYALKLEC